MAAADRQPVRAVALHALAYCERLFYLREVEGIEPANERVWAGRALHEELDEGDRMVTLTLESESLGVKGKMDAVRRRNGTLFAVEHKRGRAMRGGGKAKLPWPSDRIQALAYAFLLEEHTGEAAREVRIRYHRDNHTVRLPVEAADREDLATAVMRAHELARSTSRPAVTSDERKCVHCSLAPVCLPEETRLARALTADDAQRGTVRLFPPDLETRSLHVVTQGARVGRDGSTFAVSQRKERIAAVGAREVSDIVLHGFAQITTQALRLAADEGIPVHFVTTSGTMLGTFTGHKTGVQRRIRQFEGLRESAERARLAARVTQAKIHLQLRHVLRATRGDKEGRAQIEGSLRRLRAALRGAHHSLDFGTLLGHEGNAARAYFDAIATRVHPEAGPAMVPTGRSRRPPRDRFNALLSFAYGLLYRDVLSAIVRVGLEPSFGFLHRPRSASPPLVLDVMELFRVPIADMAVLAAVNRRTFDPVDDFEVTGAQVWLSATGRKKLIEAYERRKHEEFRHEVVGYSLSYARMMELEVRLLEKEWSGEPGLFARFRLR